jgi:broad specificity phosphatase PhoE
MKEINFYLIRHGETEWNKQNLMQGAKDSPLTEQGINGAKITGNYLSMVPFIAAYSSTQKRAMDTRDLIVAANHATTTSIPCATHCGLCEMNFGIWEGQEVSYLKSLPEFQPYLTDLARFDSQVNQGEHYLDVYARMRQALFDIIATHDSGNILIVSHGTALRLLIHVISGGDWTQHRDETLRPKLLNTSISLLNYRQSYPDQIGQFTLRQYNQVIHLT